MKRDFGFSYPLQPAVGIRAAILSSFVFRRGGTAIDLIAGKGALRCFAIEVVSPDYPADNRGFQGKIA
jgi:hypothetical protein